jgi:hypothetical protein
MTTPTARYPSLDAGVQSTTLLLLAVHGRIPSFDAAVFAGNGRTGGTGATDRWGTYAAAVTRWELLLGRSVPQPTQPGRHGSPVLAPAFVEWLMGLPSGWVSGLGLPRTAAHGCSATASSSNRPLSRCGCCYARTTGR